MEIECVLQGTEAPIGVLMGSPKKSKKEKALARARSNKLYRERKKAAGLREQRFWTGWPQGERGLVPCKLTGNWSEDIRNGHLGIEFVLKKGGIVIPNKIDFDLKQPEQEEQKSANPSCSE